MLVVKIACWAAALFGLYWTMMRLVRYCNTVAYPYEPFTRRIFFGIAAAYAMLFCGIGWYSSAIRSGGDALNGLALAVMGGALLAWIVTRHVRNTSLRVGLGISAVQLPLFAVLAYFGIIVLVIGLVLTVVFPAVMGAIAPPTVRVVNY